MNISISQFAAAMWIIDYTLSLTVYNYTSVYLHTREAGTVYNVFDPASNGDWTIGPPYYSLLVLTEALRSVDSDGSVIVSDLGLTKIASSYVAGYVVYDATGTKPQRLVLFNFGDRSSSTSGMPTVSFNIPPELAKDGKVTTKYLAAPSISEKTKITWGGQGVDGKGVLSTGNPSSQVPSVSCSNGCTVGVPGPGIVLVELNNTVSITQTKPSTKNSSPRTFVSTGIWFSWGLLILILAFVI